MLATLGLSFVALLVIGTPVASVIAGSAILSLVVGDRPLILLPQRYVGQLMSFVLVCVPLFMLSAQLMNSGGITRRLIQFARQLVGFVTGGLGVANVAVSMLFAGMSGSAIADTASIGSVLIPAMKDEGYEPEFSAGVTAASSVVGPIIPPSIPMVIAGASAQLSIVNLFLAGALPGVAMGLAMGIVSYIISLRRGHPKDVDFSARRLLSAFVSAAPSLSLPVVVVGGILLGWFTPTEASAIAVLGAVILGGLVYRELTVKAFVQACVETVRATGSVLIITGFAATFAWIISVTRSAEYVVELISSLSLAPGLALLGIVGLLLVVGTFMEPVAAMIILLPLLIPVGVELGVAPIQMTTIVVVGLMIGLITPPVGVCLFIAGNTAGISLERVTSGTLPFLIAAILVLLLVAYWPPLSLYLPGVLGV